MPAAHEAAVSLINYLIGWICILPSEYYQAVKMFDEIYDSTDIVRGRDDRNDYDIGRIGNHFVVMNCPAAGTHGEIRAAKIATDMRSTFPAIRFMLLVGIGGGSPSKRDVRLGDVVLGTKVVPYREGKETDNGFEMTGQPGSPPSILQSAITRLGFNLSRGLDLQETIHNLGPYAIDRPQKDNLYVKDYIHNDCCDCLKAEPQASGSICTRNSRNDCLVQVHQGVIGSADQVMKKASDRDKFAGLFDIICYEMEAAGIMRTISCLTVRGISDYSDGHKNDAWHSYASLSAAVCAKELLGIITVRSLSQCPLEVTQDEIERWVRGAVRQVNYSIHQSREPQKALQTAKRNLNTIVDRYGLVQELIVPELYKLVEQTDSENDRQVHDTVALLETLQKELQECLNTLCNRVSKQAKRPDNNEAMRQNWKLLKKGIDERLSWVKEVSKATHRILGHAPRRFILTASRKTNKAMQSTGHSIQHVAHQAFEHLKLLMDEYKSRFRANRKDQLKSPHQNGTPLGSIADHEYASSQSDACGPNSNSHPAQDPPIKSLSLRRDHIDDPETRPPGGPSPSSSRSGHIPSDPEFDVSTSQSPPPVPPTIDIVSVPHPPVAPTRSPPVPPTERRPPPPVPRKKRHLSLVPPARPPPQTPLITTSSLILPTGVRHPLSASEDANLSAPSSSVTARQAAEYSDDPPQGDYTLRPHGHSIQPLSAAEPVTDRGSGSEGSPMVSTAPVSREIPDFSASQSFQDLVEQFQREAIMGRPLSVRN
ncbi:hypothetical protein ZTR_06300 [Talaromyces verruculosus]|nr:hypothetical protein ZTR_06300 [Talaromyces verruculosus]